MNRYVRIGAIAVALLAGAGLAGAQSPGRDTAKPNSASQNQPPDQKLKLTPAQKAMIFTAIRRTATQVTPPPSNLLVTIGAQLPASLELYSLPDAAVADVPDVKPYKYTIVNDTLILVDPASMQVVATIRQ